jgi:hypothetical protein
MFRCYFTRSGRIAMGENLDSVTLDEAIASGEKMLTERADGDDFDGIEIWDCAAFLYASTAKQTARGNGVKACAGLLGGEATPREPDCAAAGGA